MNASAFGMLLKQYRLEAGLTQEELAERALVSARAISDLERGVNRTARRDTMRQLITALDLVPEQRAALEAASRTASQAAESGHGADNQPTRVRTFLIVDVRGYTRFTEEKGDEVAAKLAVQFAQLVERAVQPLQGQLLELRGDEALVVFSSARQALRAAVDLQQRLDDERAAGFPLHVGMGLDAGEAIPVKGGYRGRALNLAARLCDLAGRTPTGRSEVFCTETVISLAGPVEGLVWQTRGAVRLKGYAYPVPVIQVGRQGQLATLPPPLERASVGELTNLPDEPTPFIGREPEITAITALVHQASGRLVTLTGPGGTGKTRLALKVACRLLQGFPDGTYFVSLASLSDPALVPSAVAEVLTVKEEAGRDLLATLIAYLEQKRLLIVMDNFEHLLDASSVVVQVLEACRSVRILVTSRIPLRLSREQEYAVQPLSLPDLEHRVDLDMLSRYEAIELFLDRARAVKPDFRLTPSNTPAVAEICCRLDGLPLAIELAAARIKVFPPETLLAHLADRLNLLTQGPRDVPARHQTLRNTIDWSYQLLTPAEQRLFARLSVFSGGCTFEAAGAVSNLNGEKDLLAGLTALVEQNLVQQIGQSSLRFHMLETIREYAAEKLRDHGDETEARGAHAAYYLTVAQVAEPEQWGPRQRDWLEWVESDVDNLRAALTWLLSQGQAEEALRLAVDLHRLWMVHGYWREAGRWLEDGLRRADALPASVHARALDNAAAFLFALGDHEKARPLLEQAHALFKDLGDKAWQATTSRKLGDLAADRDDYEQAVALYEESLALAREAGHVRRTAHALAALGAIAVERRDLAQARVRYEEALALYRATDDAYLTAGTLAELGLVVLEQGNLQEARDRFDESLMLARELGATSVISLPLLGRGALARRQGEYEQAAEWFREGLILSGEVGDRGVILMILSEMAELAAVTGDADRAARLGGAHLAAREMGGRRHVTSQRERWERALSPAQSMQGEGAWTRAWEAGRAMSLQQAIAYALGE